MQTQISQKEIVARFDDGFLKMYTSFPSFCTDAEYAKLKNLCLDAASDTELLSHIVFCNDVFNIPPVKTFLEVHKEDLVKITGDENAFLSDFQKRAIGAFWGFVFKGILGYKSSKNVTVSLNKMFKVSTASYFIK
jgi:hypothetical protein